MADAHLAPHGEAQKRFTETLFYFMSSIPPGTFEDIQEPTWKSLNDRFKKVVQDHIKAAKVNTTASGIVEVRGEREQFLDNIVLAIDEMEENRRVERDERTALDEHLQAAGENIRNMAVSRASSTLAKNSGEGGMTTPDKRNLKRRLSVGTSATLMEDEEEDRELLRQHIAQQREVEVKRLKLAEDQLSIQREQSNGAHQRDIQRQEVDRIRLELEQKRIDLGAEKAKLDREKILTAMKERTKLAELLGALVSKLK